MKPRRRAPARPFADRKARDRALILPVVGLILFVPPIAGIFQIDVRIGGIPFTALYVFAVWAALIAGAAVVSRKLRDEDEVAGGAEASGQGPTDGGR